uniref:MFS transporter n=1 Tax=Pararhizobium sp. IMCC3301 TaxID=3067904 RepID=UPI0027424769|nr:MFS transporter [Pararhizobium sp. IMCC3301]
MVSRRGIFGWLMFDWATQPVFTLITTFIFAPYFAGRFIGDGVAGQAYWGYATAVAGVLIAVLSPILGSIADVTGRRKPWIAAFSVLLVSGAFLLWFSAPLSNAADGVVTVQTGAILLVLVSYILVTIGAEFATVFTNAMMPDLVPPERLGRLSGTGWAIGYAGGLASLVIMLGFLVAAPESGRTLLGMVPLFGLDPGLAEGTRASGPLTAVWYVVFVLPLFLFTPDTARRHGISLLSAARQGIGDLLTRIKQARQDARLFLYLLAHMLYVDGLIALFAFGGIYAQSVFGWDTTKLGLFGIFLTITGVAGALIGGRLNDRLGSIAVIRGSIIILILSSLAILSVEKSAILFVVPVSGSIAELSYYLIGGVIGAAAGPLQSASRTYLAEITEPTERTSAFGLYAMVGKVTSFAGPLAVGLLTAFSQSQRIGISALIGFLIAGFVVLGFAASAGSAVRR